VANTHPGGGKDEYLMSNANDRQGDSPPPRGEAAWKARKDDVAARNAQARKAGKQQRQEQDDQKARQRRDADRVEMADLVERSRPK
jgi:hypothetical protein